MQQPRRKPQSAGSHREKTRVGRTDTQTGMLPGVPGSTTCVQRFDDSRNSAIHITYRISLRSSSLREPRHPLLKVVYWFVFCLGLVQKEEPQSVFYGWYFHIVCKMWLKRSIRPEPKRLRSGWVLDRCGNDPSAGSPTETLLRLHLPLNDEV